MINQQGNTRFRLPNISHSNTVLPHELIGTILQLIFILIIRTKVGLQMESLCKICIEILQHQYARKEGEQERRRNSERRSLELGRKKMKTELHCLISKLKEPDLFEEETIASFSLFAEVQDRKGN